MNRFLTPALILLVFLLDRLAKVWALKHLPWGSLEVLPFFSLTYAQNTGVAFGMFRDSNLFFLVFSTALIGGLLVFRRRIQAYGRLASLGLALVLGGALGNLYDRISYGFVVDFFDFSFFPAVFNVADSAITVGAALLALGMKDEKSAGEGRAG